MKVLLDQNISKRLRFHLPGHLVLAARQLNADQLQNGGLIRFAEANGFDALVTADQNIFYQQNNEDRKVGLVVISTNDWSLIKQNVERIAAAVTACETGGFAFVNIPLPPKGLRT